MRGVPLSEALKKRGLEAGKKNCLTGNLRKEKKQLRGVPAQ